MDDLIKRLELAAARKNCVVYNIAFRRAGYAIQYAEPSRESEDNPQGVVTYRYYPSFLEMVMEELRRLES